MMSTLATNNNGDASTSFGVVEENTGIMKNAPNASSISGSSSRSNCCRTSSCFWITLRFCNTFAVAILAGVVTFLFFQLQYITYQVTQTQSQMESLLKQIQNEQQDQIDQLNEKVDQEHSLTIFQMAGTFTLLTCLLTMFHMSMHLNNYHEPIVQRKIVAILWMSPIYSITSFLSLIFPVADGYLAVIRDFYEAYVVYTFLSFLIAVLGRGNRQLVVHVLAQHADHLDRPTRCLRRWYHPPPESSDEAMANAVLTECQILCMQFVFVRPLTSIASFVMSTLYVDDTTNDNNDSGWTWHYFHSPGFFLAIVTNVTVFLAFTGLLKFYHAVREDLSWCQPFSKFMAIKGIVFLTFWQGVCIAIAVSFRQDDTHAITNDDGTTSSKEQAAQIQNVLICLEMLFFSIAHWCVFPAEEWKPDYRPPKKYHKPGIGIKDFVSDMSYIMQQKSNYNDNNKKKKMRSTKKGTLVPDHDYYNNEYDEESNVVTVPTAVAIIPEESLQQTQAQQDGSTLHSAYRSSNGDDDDDEADHGGLQPAMA